MEPKTYIALIKHFKSRPSNIQSYYNALPKLIDSGFEYEIAIAYLFIRLEQAYHRILYGGAIKLHRAEVNVARGAIETWHITRPDFLAKFQNIFGKPIAHSLRIKAEEAEKVRDAIIHGKAITEDSKRKAIVEILGYSEELDRFVYQMAGFEPFGSMQGFKGAAEPLDASTTRWILKGMGFPV